MLTTPIQPGFTSQLTIGQPQPVTPSPGALRGPWAATRERERLQQTATPTPMVYPSGLSAPSSGLPSLSGIGSAQVAACPVFASPSPATPQACLHLYMQYVFSSTLSCDRGGEDRLQEGEVCFTKTSDQRW